MEPDTISRELDERILRYIHSATPSAAAFERLALELFAYQYERIEPYRRYCDRLGRTPREATCWIDVPAVPTASFGDVRLATFPPERTVLRFVSSGTTNAGTRRSVHELDTAALYDASLRGHFARMVLPDAAALRIIGLVPPRSQAPESSLAYMVHVLIGDAAVAGSGCYIDGEQLLFEPLREALSSTDAPALVFGTAFAFVHLFDRLRADGVRFSLPPGSRIVETGGFKGRSREIERADLYASFTELLGVPRELCTSEYGMCELGSQWYDATIADRFAGRAPRLDLKIGPHWARATIVDPVTAEPVAAGCEGLVRVFDLSNRGSVSAVLTGDLGRQADDGAGFVLHGRHAGALPKGCSIDADALLGSRRD